MSAVTLDRSAAVAEAWLSAHARTGSDEQLLVCRVWGTPTGVVTPFVFPPMRLLPVGDGQGIDIVSDWGIDAYQLMACLPVLTADAVSLASSTWVCTCQLCLRLERAPRDCPAREDQLSVFTVARTGESSAWIGDFGGVRKYGPDSGSTVTGVGGPLVDAVRRTLGLAVAGGPNRAQRRAAAKR